MLTGIWLEFCQALRILLPGTHLPTPQQGGQPPLLSSQPAAARTIPSPAPPFSSPKLPCFSNPYWDTSANCLSHLPLYSPLFRAGFNVLPLFFAIFTHPLIIQADFLKFRCVTRACLLTTRHKHDSHISWEIQTQKAGHGALPHFWLEHLSSPAHYVAAWRCVARGWQERRAVLSLWQQYLLVLAETTPLKPFQTPKMDKCKQHKGTLTHCRQTHTAKLCFYSAATDPGCFLPFSDDSCLPQTFCSEMERGDSSLSQTAQYYRKKKKKAPQYF